MNATSKIKIMNAAELYTREYGAKAYQAWLRREAEITALVRTRRYSTREICRLREDNFRQMKAEGARRAAVLSVSAAHVVAKPTCAVCVRIAA